MNVKEYNSNLSDCFYYNAVKTINKFVNPDVMNKVGQSPGFQISSGIIRSSLNIIIPLDPKELLK